MSHTKGLAEVRELPCSKGGTMKFLLVSGTGIAVMCGKVGGAKVEEGNAHRIAALWNMAERLGLATEEIESGSVETKLKAAPDMLRTLESVLALINKSFGVVGYHLLCGSFLHNGEVAKWEELGIREEVEAAIKKARGEV